MPKDWLTISWKVLMLRGAVGVVFGVVAIVAPVTAALTFALLWGVWVLADGLGLVLEASQPEGGKRRGVLLGLMGVVAIAAGLVAIASPGLAAVTLTWVLGVWFIVRGVFEVGAAISSTASRPRGLLFATAVLDVVIGALFVANPGRGALGIAVVLGVVALVWGLALIAVGVVVRRQAPSGSHASAANVPSES
jgi:uncharacterized membrane protein HdeD (DUF308 family)